ncbi:hypothetical protein N7499_001402 [Penicillium canescens]|uniref:Uncharacterized protein n=1 Tax=Penicillium canescens TaxID=5083 RepID=A0AAD6I6Y3_PENCN|nr:uncharacterized protein N7446_008943 [Penicillium canescens]KAJ6034196.1 hypothetical protein N7460_008371 [Penicillium canescens]KAJ6045858.1 hypothetical protein N7444_007112 [Penicillium canescens]KAJ6052931.1 hypothetical protein N7446_008943 [Penicillium canescens]KAJ6097028.1 hypothetical protein N7499_001402 [Penicillium canescens]KAJ6165019.1 hypothetical protein N7485_008263 [Penicillium canescens]
MAYEIHPERIVPALKDKDLGTVERSYFPFAMPWMFKFLGVDIKDWPNIEACADRVGDPATQDNMSQVKIFGHNTTPEQVNTFNDAT